MVFGDCNQNLPILKNDNSFASASQPRVHMLAQFAQFFQCNGRNAWFQVEQFVILYRGKKRSNKKPIQSIKLNIERTNEYVENDLIAIWFSSREKRVIQFLHNEWLIAFAVKRKMRSTTRKRKKEKVCIYLSMFLFQHRNQLLLVDILRWFVEHWFDNVWPIVVESIITCLLQLLLLLPMLLLLVW